MKTNTAKTWWLILGITAALALAVTVGFLLGKNAAKDADASETASQPAGANESGTSIFGALLSQDNRQANPGETAMADLFSRMTEPAGSGETETNGHSGGGSLFSRTSDGTNVFSGYDFSGAGSYDGSWTYGTGGYDFSGAGSYDGSLTYGTSGYDFSGAGSDTGYWMDGTYNYVGLDFSGVGGH